MKKQYTIMSKTMKCAKYFCLKIIGVYAILTAINMNTLSGQKSYSMTKIRMINEIIAEEVVFLIDTLGNEKTNIYLAEQLVQALKNSDIEASYLDYGEPVDTVHNLILTIKQMDDDFVTLNRFSPYSIFSTGLRYSHRYEVKQYNKEPDGFWKFWFTLSIRIDKKEKGIRQAADAVAKALEKALVRKP